ncbi:MAG TPA: UDP-N-acetylmuramoyl-tripeptide--D-alanyl-D-alanine ligase [Actinomycetota bacterium]
MMPLTLAQVATIAGGRVDGDDRIVVDTVGIDTRTIPRGALFVALTGTRDGHAFLADALTRDAAAALVRGDAAVPAGLAAIRVPDPFTALTALAADARDRTKARVVAITGSSGKTCTKDFTAAVLSPAMPTAASVASFNNEIGVPLTILSVRDDTEALVVEIGARGAGHIAALMPLARPDVSVVTNVGDAHAGMFGSADAIAVAKGEIVEALGRDGCAILNADDERVAAMASRTAAAVVTFGGSPAADVRAERISLDDDARAHFTLVCEAGRAGVTLPVPGEHMVWNALAAAAVALQFGLDVEAIARTLGSVTTSPHRMRIVDAPGGWRVVDDTYNASPQSMAAALKTLALLGRGRRTWAVLGQMAELGRGSTEAHDRVGRLAVRLGVGRVVTVGPEARPLHEAARLEGMSPEDAIVAADAAEAAVFVRGAVEPGDVVLVKASRVAGLERVVDALVAEEGTA